MLSKEDVRSESHWTTSVECGQKISDAKNHPILAQKQAPSETQGSPGVCVLGPNDIGCSLSWLGGSELASELLLPHVL